MKKFIYIAITVLILSSCHNNIFDDILFRTTDDPFYDIPQTDFLTLEHTIFLTWKADDAADTYILMRSLDQSVLNFSCVYEGTETAFTDTSLTDNNRYVYRLDKTRGAKYFEGRTFAFGCSTDCRRDIYEKNDTEADATLLEYDLVCNLPCMGFITQQNEILDVDWFYVTIPPMRQADIIIGQHNLTNSNTGVQTDLRIQVSGFESQSVNHQVAYPIRNTTYEPKTFYFKIFPERTRIASGNGFCTVIEYTVSLNQIVRY